MGNFLIILGLGGCARNDKKRERAEPLFSLSPSLHSPRAAVFSPLARPTAKKPLRSKQHERGLYGGERGTDIHDRPFRLCVGGGAK